ncbi:MAG: peptidyl-prolyl cis-trans isomerase, partial [Myxococcales bacterium]|nr:peptidyl-prolyl cis-trans isomerase [Myxococcales bacterium]
GPIRSAYGLHWVFIESVTGREPAAFEAVRARAAQEVLAERRAARLSRRLAELREHYVVALP